MQYLLSIIVFLLTSVLVADNQPAKVTIVENDGYYQLLKDGTPYQIKGAGYEFNNLQSLKDHGGNSIRTWTTMGEGDKIKKLLDEAYQLGISVSLCLPVTPSRWGFDYNDSEAVKKQYELMKSEVMKYRDHPALLTWIIGNELNHSADSFAVYDAVDAMARMIHELDPNHPVTTTLAGVDSEVLKQVLLRAPNLDFISFQVYGQMAILPDFIKENNYTGPFMVTEWGAIGYWEVEKTEWGAPIEMTSTQKANNYLTGYNEKLSVLNNQLIGNYVFLWGQKQERTPTWFGLFSEHGLKTQAIDVMHYIWNEEWPDNRSPEVKLLTLNEQVAIDSINLTVGEQYNAIVEANDYDKDKLTYQWEIKPESDSQKEGGDFEENIASLRNLVISWENNAATIKAPATPGAYRLFVYVYDNNGNVGHANVPFRVIAK